MIPIIRGRNTSFLNSRKMILPILVSIVTQVFTPRTSNANPFYEQGCKTAVADRYSGMYRQETIDEYCRCQSRSRGKIQDVCLAILSKDETPMQFSNDEEFAIGAMTAVICSKRLDRLSSQQASETLVRVLSGQNLPLVLLTRADLWANAYKEVGEGAEWCIKNQ